jgi:hypothetical protein
MVDATSKRIAIVVNPAHRPGLLGNAIAVVAVGLGASAPTLGGMPLQDAAGRRFRSSATVPVPVLQSTPENLLKILDQAIAAPGLDAIVAFPVFAQTIHDFATYRTTLEGRDLTEESIAAIGIAGDSEVVRRLTQGLSLLR